MSNLIRSRKSRLTAALATAAVSLGVLAGPAAAQNTGLVVVDVDRVLNNNNITVAVPINAAANICGVSVDVLSADLASPDGVAACDADANQQVEISQSQRPGRQ